MGNKLKMRRPDFICQSERTKTYASGLVPIHCPLIAVDRTMERIGNKTTLTSGPAAMLQRYAPGRGGGLTKAMPPSGHKIIWSATPPVCRQARACPNSCNKTMTKRLTYSKNPQMGEE